MFALLIVAIGVNAVAAQHWGILEPVGENFEPRIVGGQPAVNGQFPWTVGVYMRDQWGLRYFCSGSIVRRSHILTAAHCCKGMASFQVYYGNVLLQEATVINSTKCTIHPDYNSYWLWNDIAVITLDTPITFSANASAIVLGEDIVEPDTVLEVSGFGKTNNTSGVSPKLNYISVTSISNDLCKTFFPGVPEVVEPKDVCARGPVGIGVCNGDSGSALVLTKDRKPYQVGITSYGPSRNCEIGQPAGYTRTQPYIQFVADVLNN